MIIPLLVAENDRGDINTSNKRKITWKPQTENVELVNNKTDVWSYIKSICDSVCHSFSNVLAIIQIVFSLIMVVNYNIINIFNIIM